MTPEQFKDALPPQIRNSVTPEVMASVNRTLKSAEEMEQFKANLLSFTDIMLQGKFKLDSYVSAVKYVSFKLLGHSNINAYGKTFPDKVKQWAAEGMTRQKLSAYVAAYHKSKLVTLILEQTLIPIHILNYSTLQEAINVQADLMRYAQSEKVRSDAAACLIKELKPPESNNKIEMDISTSGDKAIETLGATIQELVKQQKEMIRSGATAKEIAEGGLIVVKE